MILSCSTSSKRITHRLHMHPIYVSSQFTCMSGFRLLIPSSFDTSATCYSLNWHLNHRLHKAKQNSNQACTLFALDFDWIIIQSLTQSFRYRQRSVNCLYCQKNRPTSTREHLTAGSVIWMRITEKSLSSVRKLNAHRQGFCWQIYNWSKLKKLLSRKQVKGEAGKFTPLYLVVRIQENQLTLLNFKCIACVNINKKVTRTNFVLIGISCLQFWGLATVGQLQLILFDRIFFFNAKIKFYLNSNLNDSNFHILICKWTSQIELSPSVSRQNWTMVPHTLCKLTA